MTTIRKAMTDDIKAIKRLYRETIEAINSRDYSPEQIAAWVALGNGDEVWAQRIAGQHFIVAETDGQLSGFAALRPDGYLHSFFVHKGLQKQGIGTAMLADVETFARQNGLKELTADVSITARPYFEHKGFETLGPQTVCIGIEMTNYKMTKKR